MITGINHVTLSIKDVQESFDFYVNVLGFKPVAKWSTGTYLLAGDVWIALTLDPHLRIAMLPEYTHIAFSVALENFEALSIKIKNSKAKIWQENRTEGASLYFVDPNGHKLEIHASDLTARLENLKTHPWEKIEFFT